MHCHTMLYIHGGPAVLVFTAATLYILSRPLYRTRLSNRNIFTAVTPYLNSHPLQCTYNPDRYTLLKSRPSHCANIHGRHSAYFHGCRTVLKFTAATFLYSYNDRYTLSRFIVHRLAILTLDCIFTDFLIRNDFFRRKKGFFSRLHIYTWQNRNNN